MSTPEKSVASPIKNICRTPAQDRLKRLQGGIKKNYKSPNKRNSDSHGNKKSKSSRSKISHRLNVSNSNFKSLSTRTIAASCRNNAEETATTPPSTQQQAQRTPDWSSLRCGITLQQSANDYSPRCETAVSTPLQLQQQQQTTSENGDESLVLPFLKAKRRLPCDSLIIQQNPNASAFATSKDDDDQADVMPPKRKRHEETNLSSYVKFLEQNHAFAVKPFQEQNVAATTIFKADRKAAADEVTDVICLPDKVLKGVDDKYLRENLITTKRGFLDMMMNNRASSSLRGLFGSSTVTDTPANSRSDSNSSRNKPVFSNENRVDINKLKFFNSAKTKLKKLWEKPKAALIDSIKNLHSYSLINRSLPTSSRNIATDRLNRYRSKLLQQQKQRNFSTNEIIVPSANILSPSSSYYDCEAMDWQSSEGNDKLKEFCNKDSFVSETSSITNDSNISAYKLNSTNFIIKDVMSVKTEKSSLNSRKQDHMYFVLDTNVLLSYIVFVEELTKLSLYEETVGNILFIPYMVIQELDNLKHRGTASIRIKASRAIRFLNDKFDSNHVQGQTAIAEKEHLCQVDSPDDSIINCCLQLKKEVQHMILLTDDGNMLLKAKINGIFVTTKSDLTSKFQNKFLSLDEN